MTSLLLFVVRPIYHVLSCIILINHIITWRLLNCARWEWIQKEKLILSPGTAINDGLRSSANPKDDALIRFNWRYLKQWGKGGVGGNGPAVDIDRTSRTLHWTIPRGDSSNHGCNVPHSKLLSILLLTWALHSQSKISFSYKNKIQSSNESHFIQNK